MILDAKHIFCEGLAYGNIGTTASTNQIDCGIANANLGAGTPIWLVIETTEASDSADDKETVSFALQDSADNQTYASIYATPALAQTALVAGKRILTMPLPAAHRRYLQVAATVATTNTSKGKFRAFLTLDPQTR